MTQDRADRPPASGEGEAPASDRDQRERDTRDREAREREREREQDRRRLERLVPELIKRVVETGYEKLSDGVERITEGPDNVREFVRDMKLPKEVVSLIGSQIDETKNGLYRVVAREIRDFLDHTNVADELSRALTTLSFEIKTEVRFIPNDAKAPRPDVRSRVRVKRASQEPDPPPEAPPDDQP